MKFYRTFDIWKFNDFLIWKLYFKFNSPKKNIIQISPHLKNSPQLEKLSILLYSSSVISYIFSYHATHNKLYYRSLVSFLSVLSTVLQALYTFHPFYFHPLLISLFLLILGFSSSSLCMLVRAVHPYILIKKGDLIQLRLLSFLYVEFLFYYFYCTAFSMI